MSPESSPSSSATSHSTDSLPELQRKIAEFAAERDWSRFHSPKNLVMALSVEASELLEIFQWKTETESDSLDERTMNHAAEELADIQIYLLQIAMRLDVDMTQAVNDKMIKNAIKYPAP